MLDLACPCGSKFTLAEAIPGEEIRCPRCGQALFVPQPPPIITLEETPPPVRVQSENAICLDAPGGPLAAGDDAPLSLAPVIPITKRKWIPSSKKSVSKLARPPLPAMYVFAELLQPENLTVLAVLVAFHVAFFVCFLVLVTGVVLFAFVPVALIGIMAAHFSNVICATGAEEKHSLPTPLGNFEFAEDFWHPFLHVLVATLCCFGPAALIAAFVNNHRAGVEIKLVALAVAIYIFPMAWLAMASIGLLDNLRPDRLLGAIAASGLRYLGIVLAFIAAAGVYLAGMTALVIPCLTLIQPGVWEDDATHTPGAFTALQQHAEQWDQWGYLPGIPAGIGLVLLGLYLLYFFCWNLGLLFRRRHEQFPWIADRLEDSPRFVPPPATKYQPPAEVDAVSDAISTSRTQFPPGH